MAKRLQKECLGCGDHFATFKNYDYCQDCAVNGNRYLIKSPCSECDGSGIIKFPHQKPRPCKLCYLTKTPMKVNKDNKTRKLTAEEQEENRVYKYWDEVDQLAQQKLHQLFTTNIPFQNIKLITEPWHFEERQQKLSGLFLRRDVDYRTLLVDLESHYDEEELPDKEVLAESITLEYCRAVIKSLISSLSNYSGYDPSYFNF